MRTSIPLLSLALAAAAVAGCGQDAPRGDPLKGGEPKGSPASGGGLPAGHPPIPQGLPDDHPPLPTAGPKADPHQGISVKPGADVPAPAQESAFAWTAPEGWKSTPPASSMRLAQFDLPAAWPDGAPVVCALFGQIGGGRQANVDRWIAQFQQADGTDSKAKAKITETQRDGLTVTRVELTGTFSDGMQKPPRQTDDGMLLGGIVETAAGASIYVKLTGPRDVVSGQAAAFDAFLGSIRPR